MSEKKIVKAEGVGELIGAITALLGYMPSRSLVVAPFRGSRAEAAMRVDLPTDADTYPAFVSAVMGLTCRVEGVTGFAAIVYTDGSATEHEALAASLVRSAGFVGLDVVAIAYVTPDSWGVFFDGAGYPLADLPPLPGVDPVPEGDQMAGTALPVADPMLSLDVANAPLPHPQSVDVCTLFEEALTWDLDALDGKKVAVLIGMMSLPIFRDVALMQWATSLEQGRETLIAQRAHLTGEPISEDLAGVILGKAPRPDADRLQGALALCRVAAAHAPIDEWSAAMLTACGWLSWALGLSTHAESYITRAQAADPGLQMAHLLAEVIGHGMLPDWVFTR